MVRLTLITSDGPADEVRVSDSRTAAERARTRYANAKDGGWFTSEASRDAHRTYGTEWEGFRVGFRYQPPGDEVAA